MACNCGQVGCCSSSHTERRATPRQPLTPTFTPGELVVLKSGGPPLTFVESNAEGKCAVTWFNGDKLEIAIMGLFLILPYPPANLNKEQT